MERSKSGTYGVFMDATTPVLLVTYHACGGAILAAAAAASNTILG